MKKIDSKKIKVQAKYIRKGFLIGKKEVEKKREF